MDVELRDRWLEHAQRRLREGGLRASAGRTAVVELLAREGQCLATPAELAQRLRDAGVGSQATLYRVLDELHGLGLVHRLDGRDGVARYEVAEPDHHHHHVVDDVTGEVRAFADDDLETAIHAVAERLGVELTGHDVVLRGQVRAGGSTPGRATAADRG